MKPQVHVQYCILVGVNSPILLELFPDQWHTFAGHLAGDQGVVCDPRIVFFSCRNQTCNLGCISSVLSQN